MKTFLPKIDPNRRKWYLVDARGKVLGRLAARIADILRGKNKPIYTPHIDTGDFVIVVNAEHVVLTGKKEEQKIYMTYSRYKGCEKRRTAAQVRATHPEQLIIHAVRGMLPKNRLARQMLKRLKVYAGPNHPHAAQRPEPVELVPLRQD